MAAPRSYDELRRARDAGALQRLLVSAEADLAKFDIHAGALDRAVGEAKTRCQSFGTQLARAGAAAGSVKDMLVKAQTISVHTTEDMEHAAEGAREAIDALREAHASLKARLCADGAVDVSDHRHSNTSPTHQMPQHPSERPTLQRCVTNVRDGVAACRKILKAADQTFARSRAEMAAAASGVQAAVTLSRKQASA